MSFPPQNNYDFKHRPNSQDDDLAMALALSLSLSNEKKTPIPKAVAAAPKPHPSVPLIESMVGGYFEEKSHVRYSKNMKEDISSCLLKNFEIVNQMFDLGCPLLSPTMTYQLDDPTRTTVKQGVSIPFFDIKKEILEFPCPFAIQTFLQKNKVSKTNLIIPFTFMDNVGHCMFLCLNLSTKIVRLVDSNGLTHPVLSQGVFAKIEFFMDYYFSQINFKYEEQKKWVPNGFNMNRSFLNFETGHCVSLSILLMTIAKITDLDVPEVFKFLKTCEFVENDFKLIRVIKAFTVILHDKAALYFEKD